MGVSECQQFLFNISELITPVDLPELDLPFTKEEIDKVIKDMPSNHAHGPDGFNGFFMKKCWSTISNEFYRLCEQLWGGHIDLACLNGSLITLIPKKDSPISANDFRPISLLNYSIKLLTKLLANRLQTVILQIVHTNQYGFIKGRTIQDCLAWAFQFLHIFHHSRNEISSGF